MHALRCMLRRRQGLQRLRQGRLVRRQEIPHTCQGPALCGIADMQDRRREEERGQLAEVETRRRFPRNLLWRHQRLRNHLGIAELFGWRER